MWPMRKPIGALAIHWHLLPVMLDRLGVVVVELEDVDAARLDRYCAGRRARGGGDLRLVLIDGIVAFTVDERVGVTRVRHHEPVKRGKGPGLVCVLIQALVCAKPTVISRAEKGEQMEKVRSWLAKC